MILACGDDTGNALPCRGIAWTAASLHGDARREQTSAAAVIRLLIGARRSCCRRGEAIIIIITTTTNNLNSIEVERCVKDHAPYGRSPSPTFSSVLGKKKTVKNLFFRLFFSVKL